jgi:muramoyltetrapeptide carboxypeptidase
MDVLFGRIATIQRSLTPLNAAARMNHTLTTTVVGGNLAVLQRALTTPWEIPLQGNIVLLEEIGEPPRKIAAFLQQLLAGRLLHVAAVVFGDFLYEEPGKNAAETDAMMKEMIAEFADACPVPLLHCAGIGHGRNNHPIPFNTRSALTLGEQATLTCPTGAVQQERTTHANLTT